MVFKVNYFNGVSSKTIMADVTINPSSWHISFIDDNHIPQKKVWKIPDIKKSEVYTKGLVAFTYGESFPFQRIESEDENFIEYISQSEHKNLNNKVDTFLHKSAGKSLVLLLLAILGITLGMYFYVIPTVAEGFAKKLPNTYVVSFGDQVFKGISANLDIDNSVSEKLQDFVDVLDIDTEFNIEAHVAISDELNAFAMSGGKIVVYSGLLEKMENEHQLTALIGHEIAHVQERHVLKNVSRNLSGALFLSIILGDVNAVYSVIMENAHMFSQLSFSRSLEKEADIFGIETMKENNVDLQGMPELFEILESNSGIEIPIYLSSHPMLEERINYTKEIANKQVSFNENVELKEKWNLLKEAMDNYNNEIIIKDNE